MPFQLQPHTLSRYRRVIVVTLIGLSVLLVSGLVYSTLSPNSISGKPSQGPQKIQSDSTTQPRIAAKRRAILFRMSQFRSQQMLTTEQRIKSIELPECPFSNIGPVCGFPPPPSNQSVSTSRVGIGFLTSLPISFRSRCSEQKRSNSILQNGGTMTTEAAVLRSLEWLKAHQNPDGSWGKKAVSTSTSLALLCYLGRCESIDTPVTGDALFAAMTFLMDFGAKHESRFSEAPDNDPRALYEHAISMVAVAEIYGFAKFSIRGFPRLRESVEEGNDLLQNKDLKLSGWDADHWNDSELVTMAWQLDAYSALRATNLRLKNLRTTIATMRLVYDRGKNLATSADNTARDVLFCTLQDRLGVNDDDPDRRSACFKHLLTEPVDWSKSERLPIWFFITNFCFQKGGDVWNEWQKSCINQILAHQNSDGSFAAQPDRLLPYCPSTADDKIHRTCYATLILESYYRHQRRHE